MGGRYPLWYARHGVVPTAQAANAGKAMLGGLHSAIALGAPPSLSNSAHLPTGEVVEARMVYGSPHVTTSRPPPPAGYVEEVVHLYAGSPGGLRVFDLGTKTVVKTLTGLEPFEVDHVRADGQVVWMSGSGYAVRVDMKGMTAFARAYQVNSVSEPGVAYVAAGAGSPDGKRVLWAFVATYSSDGPQLDGMGGYVLADGTTLDAIRPALRMGFRQASAAWAPDSKRFYIAASQAADNDGTARLTAATSTKDYVAAFDADGALLGVRELGAWGAAPSTASTRMVRAIAATSSRVYVLSYTAGVLGQEGLTLFALDAESEAEILRVVAAVPVAEVTGVMQVGRAGNLSLVYYGRVDEYDTADDSLELISSTVSTDFGGDALTSTIGPGWGWSNGVMQNGPASRLGAAADIRRFFLQGAENVVRGYYGLESSSYSLDISAYAPRKRYRLANVGYRTLEKAA